MSPSDRVRKASRKPDVDRLSHTGGVLHAYRYPGTPNIADKRHTREGDQRDWGRFPLFRKALSRFASAVGRVAEWNAAARGCMGVSHSQRLI